MYSEVSGVDEFGSIVAAARSAMQMMKPRPVLSVGQFAGNERTLDRGVSPRPGKYRNMPYQIEPQESFRDPDVIETVLLWGARLGKTEMLLNLLAYGIGHDPMSSLAMYPTEDSAEKFSNKFLTPMIRGTPCVQKSVKEEKSRDGGNTILNKSFIGGTLSIIGSNSPSKLRQVQAPLVICDEIDAMEDGPEGDPVDLAYKRSDNYRYSINVSSSTPTISGSSRIEARFNSTDKRYWNVSCLRCGFENWVLTREHLDWQSVGELNDPVMICPKCGHPHDDEMRQEIVSVGKWIPTAPFNGYRGYRLNAYNTLLPAKKGYRNRLHQFVSEFLKAKSKGSGSLQVHINTVDAECFEPESQKIDASALSALKEGYDSALLPAGVLELRAAVDTQGDRYEVDVWGFGVGDESWYVEKHIILGDPERKETEEALDKYLLSTWEVEGRGRLGLGATFIDSGGLHTKAVYRFVKGKASRRIFAIKGSSNINPYDNTVEVTKHGYSKKYRCSLIMLHVSKLKLQFYQQLKRTLEINADPKINNGGPGYVHFPKDVDSDFFKSLTAEKLSRKTVGGRHIYYWNVKQDCERNERLDNRIYAAATLLQFSPDYQKLLKKNTEKGEQNIAQEKRSPAKKVRGRKTWATKY